MTSQFELYILQCSGLFQILEVDSAPKGEKHIFSYFLGGVKQLGILIFVPKSVNFFFQQMPRLVYPCDFPCLLRGLCIFAISCYRVMQNIKRINHVLNTTVYSMTNTVPLIHLVRHRKLKFVCHILRMSKEEPARRYALYIPTIGKRRPGRPRTSYLTYV